jgi:hypothetical protein
MIQRLGILGSCLFGGILACPLCQSVPTELPGTWRGLLVEAFCLRRGIFPRKGRNFTRQALPGRGGV